jgi:hypothetical protein
MRSATRTGVDIATERDHMDRRRFLKGLSGALGSITWNENGLALPVESSESFVFFVAGARFHNVAVCGGSKQRVEIKREEFAGCDCYAIYSMGEKIGYVPHKMVSKLRSRQNAVGTLCVVDQNALPWKKYVVTVESV